MVTQQQKSSLQKRMKGFFLLSEFLYVKIESLKRVSKPKSLYSKKVILIFCCFTRNLACFYTKQNKVMQCCSLALCHCISIISRIRSLPDVWKIEISSGQATYIEDHDFYIGKILCFILTYSLFTNLSSYAVATIRHLMRKTLNVLAKVVPP